MSYAWNSISRKLIMRERDRRHVEFTSHLVSLVGDYEEHLDLYQVVSSLLSISVFLMKEGAGSDEEAVEYVDQMISHAFKAFEGSDE